LTNACIRRSSKTRRSNCSFFNAETERRGEGGRKKEEGENAERRTLNSEVVREGEIAREGTKDTKEFAAENAKITKKNPRNASAALVFPLQHIDAT